MFSVVNTVLLDPLPYPNADRLVYIAGTSPGSDLPAEFNVAREFYLQYKEQSKLLEDVGFYFEFTSTMRAGDRVERIWMSAPPSSLFTTLGARPILGRLPVPADEERVAVISYGLWQSWFGGDPNVLGRTFFMAGGDRTVVGVIDPEFRFPSPNTQVWISSYVRAEGLVPGRFLACRWSAAWRRARRSMLSRTSSRPWPAGCPSDSAAAPITRASSRNTARSFVRSTRNCSEACHVRCGCSSPHRHRAAHRVRQRRQSVHRARRRTPARPRRAPRDRRHAGPAHSGPDVGGDRRRRSGRRSRDRDCGPDPARIPSGRAAGHSPAQRRPHHGLDDSVHASSP